MTNRFKQIGLSLFFLSFAFLCVSSRIIANEEAYIELAHKWAREGEAYVQYNGYIDDITKTFVKQIDRELHIYGVIYKEDRKEKIEYLYLRFYPHQRATIEEARALQWYLRNRLAQAVNAHEKIQPYLSERPFPPERIYIDLYFEEDTPRRIYYNGSVSKSYASFSSISYYAEDPFTKESILLLDETNSDSVKRNKAFTAPVGEHRVSDLEGANDQFLKRLTEILRLKYGLTVDSIAGRLAQEVEEVGAKLTSNYPLNKEAARALVLRVVDDMVNAINRDIKLKPYLKEDPFPASRVKVEIEFIDPTHLFARSAFKDDSMMRIAFDGNEITYEPVQGGKGKESFEEAQTIVRNTPPPTFIEYFSRLLQDIWYWISRMVIYIYYIIVFLIFIVFYSWQI